MMKRSTIFILFVIILISCSNNSEQVIKENDDLEKNKVEIAKKDEKAASEVIEDEEDNDENQENKAKYVLNEATWYLEPIDDEVDEKVVLLTIDDAPETYALEMAKTLKKLDVPAIFFVNGHFLETDEQKKMLKEIDDMGFTIGNHTYSHQSLPELSEEEQLDEIVKVNDQVEDIIGKRPLFFRAPFGQNTDFSKEVIQDEQMMSMNWSYGYDWNEAYMNKDALVDVMVNADELRDGANLLMHDREWTAEALSDIVQGLRDKGYDFIDPLTIKFEE